MGQELTGKTKLECFLRASQARTILCPRPMTKLVEVYGNSCRKKKLGLFNGPISTRQNLAIQAKRWPDYSRSGEWKQVQFKTVPTVEKKRSPPVEKIR